MESDPNPLPAFNLFPRLAKIGHFLLDHCRYPSRSEHFQHPLDTPYDQFVTYSEVEGQLIERRATIPQNYDSEGREV